MIGFDRLHYSLAYLITAIGLIPDLEPLSRVVLHPRMGVFGLVVGDSHNAAGTARNRRASTVLKSRF